MAETRSSSLGGIARVAAPLITAVVLIAAACSGSSGGTGPQGPAGPAGPTGPGATSDAGVDTAAAFATATPIKHVVIIFGENISYDHYFGTYPSAPNDGGVGSVSVSFPDGSVPLNNNLATPLDVDGGFVALAGLDLLNNNPNNTNAANNNAANNAVPSNPIRFGPTQGATSDQGHNYKPEQQAQNGVAMDLFPKFTGGALASPLGNNTPAGGAAVMGYYDGATIGGYWNYAHNFAMNDNSYSTQFGPSTPGAINLISGQTNGMISSNQPNGFANFSPNHVIADGQGGFTLIGDTDPAGDVCSTSTEQNLMSGKNIGDLLNAANITWGSFMGGFDLTVTNANGSSGCRRITNPTTPTFAFNSADYIPHHAWFQYYASTANPTHARPSSIAAIGSSKKADGTAEPANHNYDSHDFFDAVKAGNLPAVSFLKAPAFQDGHPGYSNPFDEQAFAITVINALQDSPFWATTTVIIAYDDSDGWYDHQAAPIVNPSSLAAIGSPAGATDTTDALNGAGICNSGVQQGKATLATALNGVGGKPVLGRCGYGTRQPLMVISPFAKKNFIDHTLTDQTSILRFIEDNWLAKARIQPGGSFDTIAGPIDNMFTFTTGTATLTGEASPRKLYLDPELLIEVPR